MLVSRSPFIAMLSRFVSDFVVLCAEFPNVCSTETVSLMSAVANVAVGAGGVL